MLAAPLPPNEPQRIAALRELGLLDSLPEESYDALVESLARALECPMAVLTLVDTRRQWFKARLGVALSETPREISFCAHAILGEGLFEVPDAAADPRFFDNPLVTQAPRVRFYAGQPLRLDGIALGTLAVMDAQPRRLDARQRDALHGLARVATDLLKGRRRLVALHAERVRLHDLARASGDWMWETDEESRYRWISGQFEPITGIPSAALLGKSVEDSPLLDASGAVLHEAGTFHALLRSHAPFSRVVTAKSTPHGRLQVSRSALPVFDDEGHFRGYRGTARDMTAQVAAQHLAAERDQLLRKLSSQIPGVMFQYVRHTDGSGSFPYISKSIKSLFGASAKDVAEDPGVIFRVLHPDDRERVAAGIAQSGRTLSLWHSEYRILRLDNGTARWLETRASPERLPDGGTLWHAFSTDVTERKLIELALRRGEARWDMAARATGLGLAEVDLASGAMALDERACNNHGLTYPATGLTLATWLESVHPADRDAARGALDRAIAERSGLQARYRVRWPNGNERVLDIVGQVTLDAEGRPATIVGTCRDATEQAAHERLLREKESAERANRAKSEFLSRVSHELRTPLNGILGFTQLMSLDRVNPLAPDQQRRVDSVLRAGRHLLGLINDVLDLARIEQEDFSLQLGAVDAQAAALACLALIAPLARESQVQLPAALPRTPSWVRADQRALEQVLMNLLSNAIKYNRPGGSVHVDVFERTDAVHIAVKDEGAGLAPNQQARLFQHFERLGAETSAVQGSGLGLVISRELAIAMGGRLEVRSEAGEGSTFTLVLQAAAPRPTPAAMAAPPEPAAPGVAVPRRVLYVEDEPLNVVLMQEVFRTCPEWTLQVAADGANGLAAARALPPDLVIVDMNLPDMNGIELVQALRLDSSTRALRCIALSADAMQPQIDAARAAGFDDYWTKPIDVPRVLTDLARVLA